MNFRDESHSVLAEMFQESFLEIFSWNLGDEFLKKLEKSSGNSDEISIDSIFKEASDIFFLHISRAILWERSED